MKYVRSGVVAVIGVIFVAAFGQSAMAQAVTLEGQVVACEDCWLEFDRTKVEYGTAEDLASGKSCMDNGEQTLLAVRQGDKFRMYTLEQGKFRLTEKTWYNYLAKRVSVTGTVKKLKDGEAFVVDAIAITADSLAERTAKAAVGADATLALKDLFGADVSLGQFKGRTVVVNFWATWCIPCKTEMPWLAAIQNDYAALGVQVIGAASDAPADSAKVLQFVKQNKINFPIWLGASKDDMTRFGVGTVLPATVIVDKDGKIAWQEIGIIKPAELRKQLDRMLSGPIAEMRKAARTGAKNDNASLVPA